MVVSHNKQILVIVIVMGKLAYVCFLLFDLDIALSHGNLEKLIQILEIKMQLHGSNN